MSRETFSFYFIYPVILIFLISLTATKGSKLEYYGGEYKNILVAISPRINSSKCLSIIEEIKGSFSEASAKLYQSTGGKAYFGNVKILIPREWQASTCISAGQPSVNRATAADSFGAADIKITAEHPIAKSLPWTRQYKPCGQSGDDILIPHEFLLSNISSSVKSQLLLHEWAKFRYGVFEEYAYLADEKYPACFTREGSMYFTSCSNSKLDPLTNTTYSDCQFEVNAQKDFLLSQLTSGNSSLMSFPHLESMKAFCTNETHNRLAATKHNIMCDRRSVEDVINNHPDFINVAKGMSSKQNSPPAFEIIQHYINKYAPGYAFVIEDSESIRTEERLRQIKQSVTQMVDMMPIGTMAAIVTFAGGVIKRPLQYANILTDEDKEKFVNFVPDLINPPFTTKLSPMLAKQASGNVNVYFILSEVIPSLNTHTSHEWNIFMITSSPSSAIPEAKDLLHNSSHSLSVLTFENNKNWLTMYSTPNMKNLITFRNCSSAEVDINICSTKASALAVDEFVELMRSQDTSHFFHKVAEADIKPGTSVFSVEPFNALIVSNFYMYFSIFTNNFEGISLTSPNQTPCQVLKVQNYNYVVKLDTSRAGCQFQSGEWRINFSSLTGNDVIHVIHAFVETSDTNSRLQVHTSLGAAKESEIIPNSQLVAVFARVTDLVDRPVISADVKLNLYDSDLVSNRSPIFLKDDGIEPDSIKNDGVYSVYLQNYSPNPSFHIGQVIVTTSSRSSQIVESLSSTTSYDAVLLDTRLNSKCCGSFVPVENTLEIEPFRYSSIIPGFRTSENFNGNTLPPSRIGNIQVISDEGKIITLQFIAPGANLDTGKVDYYESCCTTKNSSTNEEITLCYHVLSPSECSPVEPGVNQICKLNRDGLARDHVGQGNTPTVTQNETIYLSCGIRGMNFMGISGQLSSNLVEIELTLLEKSSKSNSLQCNNISDDCLPIVVFWGLIGCIGGLALILLIIIICWCWTSKKQKNSMTSKERVLMTKNNRESPKSNLPDKDSPLYNVYVNKAYIQETDGQMKLVAAEGELLPLDSNDNLVSSNKSLQPPVPSVRRRSVSVSAEIDHEPKPWTNTDLNDRLIFHSHLNNRPEPPPKPRNMSDSTFHQTSRSHENLAPVPRNRLPRMESGYANSNNSRVPVLTISSSVQNQDLPVYASVNRNGRRTTQPTSNSAMPVQQLASMLNSTSTFQRPKSYHDDPISSRNRDMPVQNRFSSNSRPPSVPIQAPSYNQRSRPSSNNVRLDAFPSSESESYSDISRGIPTLPKPPPVPPPIPNFPDNDPSFIRNSPARHNLQPKMTSNKPSLKSSMPQLPPLPPRPSGNEINGNENGQHSDEEYDDDSEHWDDEDFDFHPGVSFA